MDNDSTPCCPTCGHDPGDKKALLEAITWTYELGNKLVLALDSAREIEGDRRDLVDQERAEQERLIDVTRRQLTSAHRLHLQLKGEL